jgi:hypothetical protein
MPRSALSASTSSSKRSTKSSNYLRDMRLDTTPKSVVTPTLKQTCSASMSKSTKVAGVLQVLAPTSPTTIQSDVKVKLSISESLNTNPSLCEIVTIRRFV